LHDSEAITKHPLDFWGWTVDEPYIHYKPIPKPPIDAWKDLIDVDGKMQAVGAIQIFLSQDGLEINPAKEDSLHD
jgi:hypothetical protein